MGPKNREEADFLHSLRMTATHYDFWTEVRVGGVVDIMVPQEKKEELLAELEDRDIKHSLHIQNVQELIEKEKIPAAPERWQMTRMAPRHAMTWTEYHSLEDMYTYLDYIEAEFDFVTTEEIGQSGEGRPMRVAKICRGECGSKPSVWIDGGIHAREWISPAATTWMLKELVENDAAHPDLLDNADWFILPSANPDGYDWSRNHNRMWRIIAHENYNAENSDNDVALLKLTEPIDLDIYTPACVAQTGDTFIGQNAWVYGWGATSFGGIYPDKLKEVEVKIVSEEVCKVAMEGYDITDGMRCAGGVGGEDGCQGDSGGPLTVDVDGQHTLVGDVSWGNGCGLEGQYGVYAETAFYQGWIDKNIQDNGGAEYCPVEELDLTGIIDPKKIFSNPRYFQI